MNSDTLIIIIIFASLGLLVFLFVISKLYRSLSATSNPLPPVQPLAHHRQSYYQLHHYSKSSLLDDDLDYILVDPQPPFHQRPPSSCSTTRTPRPTSIASSSRLSPSPSVLSSGRIGLPHSPHSQIHLVLPAPLSRSPSISDTPPASEFGQVSPSPTTRRPGSSSRPSSRHFLDVSSEYDRRSMSLVDRWLPTPQTDSSQNYDTPTQRRTPSPLIPLSSSCSSSLDQAQSQSQSRRSIATTLRIPSPSPSVSPSTLDPGTIPTPNKSISNQVQNPIPIIPSAITPDNNIPDDNTPPTLEV